MVLGLLTAATTVAGSLAGSILGGAKKSIGRRKKTISKEPIWSSGTTSEGEYLSSGARKAIFRQSRAKIGSSSSLIPISSNAIVPSPGGKISAEGMESTKGKTLEERVTNNEKKITVIKRIVKIQQQPFAGGQLAEINAILQDIGNALALDFSNRISKEEAEIDGLRQDREGRKRSGAEAGVERIKRVQSSLNKAFSKVIAPAKGLLGGILGFFSNILQGWIANKGLKWLSKNGDLVVKFFDLITKNAAGILLGGLGIGAGSIALKVKGMWDWLRGPKTMDSRSAKRVSGRVMRRYARRFKKGKAIQKFGKKEFFKKLRGNKLGRSRSTNLARNIITKALGRTGTKKLLVPVLKIIKKFISPQLRAIPVLGSLLDFVLNVFVFKEPVGRSAFKAIGAGLAAWLGGAIGTLFGPGVGTWIGAALGGWAGDKLGGVIYDVIFKGKKDLSTMDGSEDTGQIESQSQTSDYNNLVETIANKDTGLNFSRRDTPPLDLRGQRKGGVEVMDPIQINNMISNNQVQSAGGIIDSMPIVSAEDASQWIEKQSVMDGLGIEV